MAAASDADDEQLDDVQLLDAMESPPLPPSSCAYALAIISAQGQAKTHTQAYPQVQEEPGSGTGGAGPGTGPGPGSEQCGASLRLLHIGTMELTTVLQMGHLNVKNA